MRAHGHGVEYYFEILTVETSCFVRSTGLSMIKVSSGILINNST
jgi:hypothetical protein